MQTTIAYKAVNCANNLIPYSSFQTVSYRQLNIQMDEGNEQYRYFLVQSYLDRLNTRFLVLVSN